MHPPLDIYIVVNARQSESAQASHLSFCQRVLDAFRIRYGLLVSGLLELLLIRPFRPWCQHFLA